ncbi:MAG: type II secretion system F family protein [Methylacidiphilales bacterium]|nr:type II secretion system F family protein [Candidatus Methylacidiphilales bacterium]
MAGKKVFVYKAKNKNGREVKGEIEAITTEFAKLLLNRQGYIISSIKEKSSGFFGGKNKVKAEEIAIVLRQIATMLNSGITIVQALSIIALGNPNRELQKSLLDIKGNIEGGSQLSQALSRHPQLFDSLSISLIAAGEKSGSLDKLMDKLAVYKEKNETLKKKVKKAMNYPIAVILIAVLVSTLLLVKVVPQFASIFAGFGAELPAFTQVIVNASNALVKYWLIIVVAIVVIYIQIKKLSQNSEAFKLWVDVTVLKLPVVKKIVRGSAIARFARTLATMFAAGVPLTEALVNVAPATGNRLYERAVLQVAKDIAQGDQMQTCLKRHRHLFDEFVIQLVQIGEEAGSLESMLNKVADYYETEVDTLVDSMSSLMEPIIISILGIMVGGLVVAMYLPIFKLGSVVG